MAFNGTTGQSTFLNFPWIQTAVSTTLRGARSLCYSGYLPRQARRPEGL